MGNKIKIAIIGTECEKYLKKHSDTKNVGVPKLFDEYVVVFPKTVKDFVNEGNQQHNCVGSYPNAVIERQKIVFFIRRKNYPMDSFITAECTKRGLGQFYYANNRPVNDEKLCAFGKYIANTILHGQSVGEITSFAS